MLRNRGEGLHVLHVVRMTPPPYEAKLQRVPPLHEQLLLMLPADHECGREQASS